MSRPSPFGHPCLLGFDGIEQALDRVSRAGDGYPPYNIERVAEVAGQPDRFRITVAVAGFAPAQLELTLEANQLVVRGRHLDEAPRQTFLHRGIAARQFQRTFLLADGMEVLGADLADGLLAIDLAKPEPTMLVRRIEIVCRD